VLGHVSRGELSECKHDPVGRELPDWLALVDHLKVGICIPNPYHVNPDPAFYFNADPDPAFHFHADPDPAAGLARASLSP